MTITEATLATETTRVHQLLAAIAATDSKLEKEALVKAAMANPLFMRVVIAAYDPFTTYGIKKAPAQQFDPELSVQNLEMEHPWNVLRRLATRELSGNNARLEVQEVINYLTPEGASIFQRIINKDLRAGFTEGTVNRVCPKTIAEFPYMRCSLPPKSNMKKWSWPVGIISQLKADGMFVNIDRVGTSEVSLRTRQGSPIPLDALPELVAVLLSTLVDNHQTHGELEVLIDGVVAPREVGNGILNHIIAGGSLEANQQVRAMVWDQIPLAAVVKKGKFEQAYKARLMKLIAQLKHVDKSPLLVLIPTKVVHSEAEGQAHYREQLAAGKEGTVLKHPDAIWKDGTSTDQVKFKLEVVVELEVCGFNEGTGKFEGQLGSLQCMSAGGLLKVDVSGRGDVMRAQVWENKDDWMGAIIAVKANAIIESESNPGLKSLFLPIFVERRNDKTAADSLESIEAQFAAAIKG